MVTTWADLVVIRPSLRQNFISASTRSVSSTFRPHRVCLSHLELGLLTPSMCSIECCTVSIGGSLICSNELRIALDCFCSGPHCNHIRVIGSLAHLRPISPLPHLLFTQPLLPSLLRLPSSSPEMAAGNPPCTNVVQWPLCSSGRPAGVRAHR